MFLFLSYGPFSFLSLGSFGVFFSSKDDRGDCGDIIGPRKGRAHLVRRRILMGSSIFQRRQKVSSSLPLALKMVSLTSDNYSHLFSTLLRPCLFWKEEESKVPFPLKRERMTWHGLNAPLYGEPFLRVRERLCGIWRCFNLLEETGHHSPTIFSHADRFGLEVEGVYWE